MNQKYKEAAWQEQNNSVGIATGLQIGRSRNLGSIPGKIKRFICSPNHSGVLWGPTHPPVQSGMEPLSLEVKLPRREADQSSPSNIQVKNIWSYISLPYTPSRCGARGPIFYFLHLRKTSNFLDFWIQPALLLFSSSTKNKNYTTTAYILVFGYFLSKPMRMLSNGLAMSW